MSDSNSEIMPRPDSIEKAAKANAGKPSKRSRGDAHEAQADDPSPHELDERESKIRPERKAMGPAIEEFEQEESSVDPTDPEEADDTDTPGNSTEFGDN